MGGVAYQMGGSACPRCGGTAEVRTAADLFGALSAASDTFQRFGQPAGDPQFGQPAGQPQFGQPAGQPQFGQPAGQPQFGQPADQHPGTQQPGQPGAGQQDGPPPFGPSPFGPMPYGPQDPAGPGQGPAAGQDQGQGRRWGRGRNKDDDDYDHFNVEGSNRGSQSSNRGWRDLELSGNIVDDIGGVVADAALGFAGRAIGRRMMKAFEERVIPAVQARAAQAQQQFGQQRGDLDAIASRYPELRGCLRDQVIFVDGGTRTVQFSELTMPLTLAQADAVVARLR
jgi:hypothetical protein